MIELKPMVNYVPFCAEYIIDLCYPTPKMRQFEKAYLLVSKLDGKLRLVVYPKVLSMLLKSGRYHSHVIECLSGESINPVQTKLLLIHNVSDSPSIIKNVNL